MARSRKTTIDKLDTAIQKILDEYNDTINENLDLVTKKMGQKGAAALRSASRETFGGTGEYARGWKFGERNTRRSKKTVIYNDHYSMPHLLENSHLVRNGTKRVVGAYRGRQHIKPIADDLVSTYQEEVLKKL